MKPALAVLLAVLAACGGAKHVCSAGGTQACAGPAGCSGTQVCSADGSGWQGCSCADGGSCTPGESQGCAGAGGCPGLQTCAPDGTGWSGCACDLACTPSAVEPCVDGATGCSGTQVCAADGTAWGACDCPITCSPGEAQACQGPGFCDGSEICASDGSGYGSCLCNPVCDAGATRGCSATSCNGTQLCNATGTGWTGCVCATACGPNATQACAGPGGCSGSRSCASDGSGWSACRCPGPTTGALALAWAFADGGSCEAAGVAFVALSAADAGALLPCRDPSGRSGATLAGLPAGPLALTITGEDIARIALYQLSSSASVPPGDAGLAALDVPPLPGTFGASQLTLRWTFGGQGCAAAGVSQVTVTVNAPGNPGAPSQAAVPCTGAAGVDGFTAPGFAAGSYPFVIAATGTAQSYHGSGTVHADGLPSDAVWLDVPPATESSATGSLSPAWTFAGAGCADAGVDQTVAFLVDAQGAVAGDGSGGSSLEIVVCGAAASAYASLPPGSYWLDVLGLASNAVAFEDLGTQVAVLAGGQASVSIDLQPLP